MSATIREWRNEEWEHSEKARSQFDLQRMAKEILNKAEHIENTPTPGQSRPDLSRCYVCTSSLLPNTKYVIHIDGFTVQDITEIITQEVR